MRFLRSYVCYESRPNEVTPRYSIPHASTPTINTSNQGSFNPGTSPTNGITSPVKESSLGHIEQHAADTSIDASVDEPDADKPMADESAAQVKEL